MPRSTDEGFKEFLRTLTPSETESEAAKSHRASIKSCLDSEYTVYRFLRIGSFGNGTSVSGYSDVDYLAEVAAGNLTFDSNYCLSKLRGILDARFPRTGVAVRTPAVLVPFGTGGKDATEIVLAYETNESKDGHPVYAIADGSGRWMRTAPDVHKAYVAKQDRRLSDKVRPLVRLIKAWKFARQVPISSFYLEMRVAEYSTGEPFILYYHDVKRFLCWLDGLGLADLQDPCGISGNIPACKTEAQKLDALSKLSTAATRATKALDSASADNIADAFDWWRLLYNNWFPTYYY